MARTKKSNKKNDETPKIIRNYDPMSLEKRLYDLDHAPQRSWDLYAMEKRIYDLEQGGSPTPPTPIPALQTFRRTKTDALSGSYTVIEDTTLTLWTSISDGVSSYYSMKINGEAWDISSYFVSSDNVSNNCGYCLYENIPVSKDDIISWNVGYSNRYFIAFG